MSASSASSSLVILTTHKDWRSWKDNIDIFADQYSVRMYIDPTVAAPGLPEEPKRPLVTDIKKTVPEEGAQPDAQGNIPQRTTVYSDLNTNEQELFRLQTV